MNNPTYTAFMTHHTVHIYWDHTEAQAIQAQVHFVQGIDPDYWLYLLNSHLPKDNTESPSEHAMVALRTTLYQASETLFSLVGAFLQAPHLPLAWVLSYTNGNLRQLIQAINDWQPLPNRHNQPVVTWYWLTETLISPHKSDPWDPTVFLDRMPGFLTQLAKQFTDEAHSAEYNSLKHGFRLTSGHTISYRMYHGDPTQGIQMMGNNMSQFFAAAELRGGKNRAEKTFTIKRHNLNWNWKNMAAQLRIVVSLIHLLKFQLHQALGIAPYMKEIDLPMQEKDFDAPWAPDPSSGTLLGEHDPGVPKEHMQYYAQQIRETAQKMLESLYGETLPKTPQ